jgi:hypothetical protein
LEDTKRRRRLTFGVISKKKEGKPDEHYGMTELISDLTEQELDDAKAKLLLEIK